MPGRFSLQRRIILLVTVGMLLMLAGLSISSWLAVKESIDRVLQERLALAQTSGNYLEYTLRQNMARLENVAFMQGSAPAESGLGVDRGALHEAYLGSIFNEGVFLADEKGSILWWEPPRPEALKVNLSSYAHIRQALESSRPVVSNVFQSPLEGKPVVSVVVPFKTREERLPRLVGGDLDPTRSRLAEVVQAVSLGWTGYIEVVDGQGVVVASTRPERVLANSDHGETLANLIQKKQTTVGTCHSCHQASPAQPPEAEVMAFAPLVSFPWGVAVRQAEREALAPAQSMQWRFLGFGVLIFGTALALAWGLGRSLIRPISALTLAAQRITQGNLAEPIPPQGADEIGHLGQSLDTMRRELQASLEKIQEWNRDLEREVRRRTQELEASYEEIQRKEAARRELLHKVITAQEEERKRLARELHDDTSQSLAALLMAMDTASSQPAAQQWQSMKDLTSRALEGVRRLIFDLRPAVLDDLGLVSALRWYAENRLTSLGMKFRLEVTGEERRLPPQVETTLFRVGQEAITNVAKHAEADNVVISLEFRENAVALEVEDDGQGFDPEAVARAGDGKQGLGLVGMRERLALVDGKFSLESEPGGGTRLSFEVPLPKEGSPRA